MHTLNLMSWQICVQSRLAFESFFTYYLSLCKIYKHINSKHYPVSTVTDVQLRSALLRDHQAYLWEQRIYFRLLGLWRIPDTHILFRQTPFAHIGNERSLARLRAQHAHAEPEHGKPALCCDWAQRLSCCALGRYNKFFTKFLRCFEYLRLFSFLCHRLTHV